MDLVAVDWSGAREPLRNLWAATARDGVLVDLHPLATRLDAVTEVITLAQNAGSPLVAGFDFAFSFPRWFLGHHGLASARAAWQLAGRHGESWLAGCPPPFFGLKGSKRPGAAALFRQTERRCAASGAGQPKSVFQIGGAGAVGKGSIRGMPYLSMLADAGFSIWPFDDPGRWTAVEIYPRLLTGPVVKRSPEARAGLLADLVDAGRLTDEQAARAAISEDAFDAVVSVLAMAQHVTGGRLEGLGPAGEVERLEGAIWVPPTSGGTERSGAGGGDPYGSAPVCADDQGTRLSLGPL